MYNWGEPEQMVKLCVIHISMVVWYVMSDTHVPPYVMYSNALQHSGDRMNKFSLGMRHYHMGLQDCGQCERDCCFS